jgi:DNA-binding NarL/FixJ family response regulator
MNEYKLSKSELNTYLQEGEDATALAQYDEQAVDTCDMLQCAKDGDAKGFYSLLKHYETLLRKNMANNVKEDAPEVKGEWVSTHDEAAIDVYVDAVSLMLNRDITPKKAVQLAQSYSYDTHTSNRFATSAMQVKGKKLLLKLQEYIEFELRSTLDVTINSETTLSSFMKQIRTRPRIPRQAVVEAPVKLTKDDRNKLILLGKQLGKTQTTVATELNVSLRTIKRYWNKD